MMTSSNEKFSALLAIYTGNSPVTGEFPEQRPVTRVFDIFFDLRLNKRLIKQSWGWWFETLSRALWRHCYANDNTFRSRNESVSSTWPEDSWDAMNFSWRLHLCWIRSSNTHVAQIPQCMGLISHNALFCNRNVHMCGHFCYKTVHYGTFIWWFVAFLDGSIWIVEYYVTSNVDIWDQLWQKSCCPHSR